MCPTQVSNKSVQQECLTRAFRNSVKQGCPTRTSPQCVPQKCQIRVSSKSVLPERFAIVSSKGVLQDCHLSVSSQGVPQVVSLEHVTNTYCLCYSTSVSAFGFLGFILFFWGGVIASVRFRLGAVPPLAPWTSPHTLFGAACRCIFFYKRPLWALGVFCMVFVRNHVWRCFALVFHEKLPLWGCYVWLL